MKRRLKTLGYVILFLVLAAVSLWMPGLSPFTFAVRKETSFQGLYITISHPTQWRREPAMKRSSEGIISGLFRTEDYEQIVVVWLAPNQSNHEDILSNLKHGFPTPIELRISNEAPGRLDQLEAMTYEVAFQRDEEERSGLLVIAIESGTAYCVLFSSRHGPAMEDPILRDFADSIRFRR